MKNFYNDYRINLISPADMEETDFEKFHTGLGVAMKVLKYQNEGADMVLEETGHRLVERSTAVFLNRVAKLDLELDEGEEEVDMCLAMEKRSQKDKVTGAIEGMRLMGASDGDIVAKIVENFNVTKEYVLALLSPKPI